MNVGVGKADLYLFYRFVEVNLRVGDTDVSDAFRVHEYDVLFPADEQPQDEVGVEIACLEESNAAPLAEITKQVEFLALEEPTITVVKGF